jgi:hypothetical protein
VKGGMTVRSKVMAWMSVVMLLGPQWLTGSAAAGAAEVAGVITEIHVGQGQAEVRRAGSQDWRPVRPLLTLNAGDTVRVGLDASVVILLNGHRGSVTVDATHSPFEVLAPPAERGTLGRGWVLLEESFKALLKASDDSGQVTLGSRGGGRPPTILTPRNGPVLPDALVFEWVGSRSSRYTIRVVGPSGLVLERKHVAGTTFAYPADAVPLAPGVRYEFQVITAGKLPEKAWFEVADPVRAATIRQDLAELAAAAGPVVSPNTLVATQVAYLTSQGLLVDARLTLVAALANQADDVTMHVLLGDLYARLGLPELAAESFDEARFLSRSRSQR